MTIEEALRTAIEYEKRVVELYREAARVVTDPAGNKFFSVLLREEQGHVDYLNSRLTEWQKTGKVTAEKLASALPSRFKVDEGVGKLAAKLKEAEKTAGLELLKRAQRVEDETSDFYKKMVAELPPEGQELFARFLEIEDGHGAIVQAEIDSLNGSGYWFDVREFDLEGE